MKTNEWQKISTSFERALAMSEEEQQTYLAVLSRTEGEDFVREVSALLQADHDSSEFLHTNAMHVTAQYLAHSEIAMPEKFGNYRLLEKLGAGGMGEVFLAEDETLGRRVALKFLPQLFTQDEAQLARFDREARAASALNHPNILTVYEIGSAHGRAFIATEFVEGQTLRARIAQQNLTVPEIVKITQQIAEALHAAHAAGIIHRDIKPENIMIRPDGYVKVLDFGLARVVGLRIVDCGLRIEEESEAQADLNNPQSAIHNPQSDHPQSAIRNPQSNNPQSTHPDAVMGTPQYMSPEQVRGAALDGRTDLWSLGVTLYEMLTGQALFAGASTKQILQTISAPEPTELRLAHQQKNWQPLLQKAVAKESSQRFQSAQEFLAALKRVQSSPENARKISRRRIVAAAALLLVFFAGLFVWQKTRPPLLQAEKLYWERSEADKNNFVKSAAQTIAAQLGNNPAPLTDTEIVLIKKHVEMYVAKRNSLATTPGQESMKAVYARASVYAPFISEAFRARHLPPILGLYVAMNETQYHPCTESAVGAKGLFSFMPQTAELYGLRITPPDERCDPHKIATAAARYLADLTHIFGTDADAMTFVMVAYNCGEICVAQKLTELRKQQINPANIWGLLAQNEKLRAPLGKESQNYVPKFFAAAVIGENPAHFGLEIQPLSHYGSR